MTPATNVVSLVARTGTPAATAVILAARLAAPVEAKAGPVSREDSRTNGSLS